MKITITGSLGNTSKPLAQALLKAGHTVTIISSQADRQPAIEALGAKAAIGSLNDVTFLTSAFTGADAVYAMTPPNMGGSNIRANTVKAGETIIKALLAADVKRVVLLSSVGADVPAGNGPIGGLYDIEQVYAQHKELNVTFLRAGYFYLNFLNDIPMIKAAHIIGGNFPATAQLPLVHPTDIAAAAAEELQRPATGQQVRYIISDERTPADVAAVLGAATGNEGLPWVEFTDEQSLQGMIQAGLPEEMAGLYTEMGSGFRKGIIQKDFLAQGAPVTGNIKLEDFAREFAAKF